MSRRKKKAARPLPDRVRAATAAALLTRLCLQAACAVWIVILAGALIAGLVILPQLLVVMAVLAVLTAGACRYDLGGWAFGTSRLATPRELLAAGLLRGGPGL